MEQNFEQRVNRLEQRQDTFEATFKMYMDQQRERDIRHDAEMRELRKELNEKISQIDAKFEAKFEQMDAKFEAKFEQMNDKMDSLARYVQNLTLTAMVGIGGITAAVIAFVASYIVRTVP